MLAAAILAAGESRRMGSPKALATFQGQTFVQHLIEATRHPRIGMVCVVLGAGAEKLRQQLGLGHSQAVINENWPQGQLSSIQAAIRSLPEGIEGLVLCPVDHPLISREVVGALLREFDSRGKQIVLPKYRGKRGHPVIFAASLFSELLSASPEIGARQVVWAHADDVLEVETNEEGVLLNLNDPESLKRVNETYARGEKS
jgi:molybdenum cofactor cytidylyltransferase